MLSFLAFNVVAGLPVAPEPRRRPRSDNDGGEYRCHVGGLGGRSRCHKVGGGRGRRGPERGERERVHRGPLGFLWRR